MNSLVLLLALAAQNSGPYQITHTFVLGGDGRWDYVTPDPAHHRVFIARQDRFMVVDARTGSSHIVGHVGRPTGIAAARGLLYVGDASDGSVPNVNSCPLNFQIRSRNEATLIFGAICHVRRATASRTC